MITNVFPQAFAKDRRDQLVICLMGPTAAGKTDLAIEWAKGTPIEVISVDSAMVYRGMDIGTSKPTAAQLEIAPHHLIDVRDPNEPYSAAEFRKDALSCIKHIRARGRIPVLVGGTFLYFRALLQGLSPLPSAHPAIRARLLQEGEQFGWPQLHERLKQVDPQAAAGIHPNDPQRLQRALEVYELTGQPISSFWQQNRNNKQLNEGTLQESIPTFKTFAILPQDRSQLHQRIAQRFHSMLEAGLVNEVEQFYRRGDLSSDLPSMRAVGYRQVWEHLEGKYSYSEMVDRAIAATRQLAKRQLTWLRKLPDINKVNIR